MSHLLHVGFAFQHGTRTKELEPIFNKGLDWIRYAPTCWMVRTTSPPSQWLTRLKPHLDPSDIVFIAPIDVKQRAGWLPDWAWEWVRKNS